MLASIFKDSKSALAFAASIIVCALLLIGPKDNGGLLDRTVSSYKEERAHIVQNAAMTSAQMSTPSVGDYKPQASGLEEPDNGFEAAASAAAEPKVIRLDPVTNLPIGEVPPPPPLGAESAESSAIYATPMTQVASEPAVTPREAVITSRMIRIEPK
ncbi:MAG: hypothetical protein ACK4IS_10835 [Erythrobacter sp.]